jgi:hypothetical protein
MMPESGRTDCRRNPVFGWRFDELIYGYDTCAHPPG